MSKVKLHIPANVLVGYERGGEKLHRHYYAGTRDVPVKDARKLLGAKLATRSAPAKANGKEHDG